MKSLDVKKLKYNYRKIVDGEMNDFLKDERSSYLKFLKSFPLYPSSKTGKTLGYFPSL